MTKPLAVTSVGEAPDHERRRRMLIYTISMTTRFACVALVVYTTGVWQWIFAIGAIFLPYFAVIVANNVGGQTKEVAEHKRIEPLAIDLSEHLKDKP